MSILNSVKSTLDQPLITKTLISLAVLAIIAILARPQLTAATAIRIDYSGGSCISTQSRLLGAKPGQTITFQVMSSQDDVFILKAFDVRRELKADRPAFITVKADDKTGWYEYRLERCSEPGHFAVFKEDGEYEAPTSSNMFPGHSSDGAHHMNSSHESETEQHGTDHSRTPH